MLNNYSRELPAQTAKIRDLRKHNHVSETILKEFGSKVYEFISAHSKVESDSSMVFMTNDTFNVASLSDNYFNSIINLKRINDTKYINKLFEAVNAKLPENGVFIGCVETTELRKNRLLHKYPVGVAHIYYAFDFVFKRIFPKLPITKKIYFKITAGRNRVISKSETMGRLYSCGFSILAEALINNHLYFVVRKVKEPSYDPEPSYGPIYKMKRVGKDGKIIYVYKVRTMYAFSEYLQQYVYEKNSLQEGGKFKNDFRISTVGKFFRRYWLDELPMLINLLKGELKLVGVRPLTPHYLSLYSDELREKRLRQKPGLIPPFYVDLPKTLEQIMDSELRYIEQHEKAPFKTDLKYFFKALHNILIRRARSK
jgi:lipopolysaccharide/colanic/teichoic acid biosynthesis glycosyltransferase